MSRSDIRRLDEVVSDNPCDPPTDIAEAAAAVGCIACKSLLEEEELQQTSFRLSDAVRRLLDIPLEEGLHPAAVTLMDLSVTLSLKTVRIADHFNPLDATVWAHDAEPNLLLIEHLRTQFDETLARLRPSLPADIAEEVLARRKTLFSMLDALIADVTSVTRSAMNALVAQQAAPSPFCVRP